MCNNSQKFQLYRLLQVLFIYSKPFLAVANNSSIDSPFIKVLISLLKIMNDLCFILKCFCSVSVLVNCPFKVFQQS